MESVIKTIKFEWRWRAQMASYILFLEMGNNDNRNFAKKELMKLADKLDKYNEQNIKQIE